MTYFYVCAYYEEYLLRFWHTLIDHSLAPRLRRRLMWVSAIITVLAVGIYVGILLGQWDKKDFTVALEGACPNCAYTNWCWETIYQDTSMLGFPAAVIALSLRSHEWKPNENYLRQQLGFRGLFRLAVSFICWLPVIVYYWPAYTGVPARICATPWKNLIATCLTWIALPWLFNRFGMKIDGDIAEHSPPIIVAQYHKIVDDSRDGDVGEVFADKESGSGTFESHRSMPNGWVMDSPSSCSEDELFGGPSGKPSGRNLPENQPKGRGLADMIDKKKAKEAKTLADRLFL